jgi:hypothetical protein
MSSWHAAATGWARSFSAGASAFSRSDITEPANVDEWIRNIEAGSTVTFWSNRMAPVRGALAFT